jgi:5-methyltetrahydrofolate--homocysteine methyltransferase
MPEQGLIELSRMRTVIFDGAMGTEMMKRGLSQGEAPETWNTGRPEVLREIHSAYFDGGADVVSTNSFGATPIRLASHGLADRARELNMAAARLAASCRPAGKFVAGSLGPTGKFLKPQGDFTESQFEETFGVQAAALAEGGADALIIETMFDLREASCALRAARSATDLPVLVTMTYNRTKRGYFTLMGQSVADCVRGLESAGAAAVGANCTLSSDAMIDLARELRLATRLPVIVQPNAGQPRINEGASIAGGCCGTTPAHVRALSLALSGR